MKIIKQSCKGSIAVETALVVPIVIITVVLVLYIMLIIFQTSLMQITANNIAERTAAAYYKDASVVSGRTSKGNIANLSLYRRWISNSVIEQNDFEAAAMNTLNQRSILKGSGDIDIGSNGNFISQKITVMLSCTYNNPLGSLTRLWGGENKITLRVRAKATIDDPAEVIRNSDFIIETASKLPVISDFESKWQDIIHKIIDYVDKLTKEKVVANA